MSLRFPLVNKMRAKMGKKPLENENRSYRDILKD